MIRRNQNKTKPKKFLNRVGGHRRLNFVMFIYFITVFICNFYLYLSCSVHACFLIPKPNKYKTYLKYETQNLLFPFMEISCH